MTVASLIERLKTAHRTPQNTEKIQGVLAQNTAVSLGESHPRTPRTPRTPTKVDGQTKITEVIPFAPVWTAPVIGPEPVPTPLPETWRQHDKANQSHYWNCPQCKAVVVQRQPGDRCPEGQRLNDAYIEAATREGRFIGSRQKVRQHQ